MAEEQQTLQTAGEESVEEQKDIANYTKMSIVILEKYVHLARDQGLDDPIDEQTAHCLIV